MYFERNMKTIVEKEESIRPFVILSIVIILLWVSSFFGIYYTIDNWADRGTFGDLFGAINSLFSGLALAGIIFTIFLQRKELRLQRLELIETRKELNRSAEAQEKSEIALKQQAESLKLASQLSALNSLVSAYSEQEIYWTGKHLTKENQARREKEKYMKKVENILNIL